MRSYNVWEYSLTPAGEDLRPIIMALGHWGAQWIGSRLRKDELDPGFLMWDVRRFVRIDEFRPTPWSSVPVSRCTPASGTVP